jgi:hypothetical protein
LTAIFFGGEIHLRKRLAGTVKEQSRTHVLCFGFLELDGFLKLDGLLELRRLFGFQPSPLRIVVKRAENTS